MRNTINIRDYGKGEIIRPQITSLLLLLLLSCFSRVRLCATPQTAAHQAPPSMGFSRQEYWSRVPLPSPDHFTREEKVQKRVGGTDKEVVVLQQWESKDNLSLSLSPIRLPLLPSLSSIP